MAPPLLPPAPPLPTSDLLSFLFPPSSITPPYDYDISRPLFVSAEDPEDPTQSYTYLQSYRLILKLIAGFRSLPTFQQAQATGAQPVILIHSFNSVLYPILVLSVIGSGAIFTGTNPAYTPFELEHALKSTGASIILCEPDAPDSPMLTNMRNAMSKLNIPESSLFILDSRPNQLLPKDSHFSPWRTLLTHGSQPWTAWSSSPTRSATTPAALFFSSGTTGPPKPVTITHLNLLAQHSLVYTPYATHRATSPHYLSSDGCKSVMPIPLFHIGLGPLTFVTFTAEHAFRTAYIMRRFDLPLFLELNHRYQCTEFLAVPPIAAAILQSGLADPKHPNYRKECGLRSVRYGLIGGAPQGAASQRELRKLMGKDAVLGQLWGMTELTSIASFVPPVTEVSGGDVVEVAGSVGYTTPGLEMKAVDPSGGKPVPDGTPGEIWARGPTTTPGYFITVGHHTREIATAANQDLFAEPDWIKSGDLGYRDPESGLWYIVGRLKELIKVRGFQVSPSEIEDVIRNNVSGVADVAVVGVEKLPGGEEVPRAFVVRNTDDEGGGKKVTEKMVMMAVKGNLARYKCLEGGVRFVEVIPRNASGKILRRVLKKEMVAGKGGARL